MKKITLRIAMASLVIALVGYLSTSKMPTEWNEYVVGYGDTVCDISIDVTPNDKDYREVEYYITKKNNIDNASIYPGQTILVPVYK